MLLKSLYSTISEAWVRTLPKTPDFIISPSRHELLRKLAGSKNGALRGIITDDESIWWDAWAARHGDMEIKFKIRRPYIAAFMYEGADNYILDLWVDEGKLEDYREAQRIKNMEFKTKVHRG